MTLMSCDGAWTLCAATDASPENARTEYRGNRFNSPSTARSIPSRLMGIRIRSIPSNRENGTSLSTVASATRQDGSPLASAVGETRMSSLTPQAFFHGRTSREVRDSSFMVPSRFREC